MPLLLLAIWLVVSSGVFCSLEAQQFSGMKPAVGRLLIADRGMRDPRFAKSVILLIRYEEKGALGLIVNKPSDVKLADLLPDAEELKDRDDPVYVGGPVARDGMMLMLRSEEPPGEANHVLADIYVSPSRDLLDRLVAEGDRRFRTYVGYAGWAPGQLEGELKRGDWHVLPSDPEMVFAAEPESVWDELIKQTEVLFAGLRQPQPDRLVDGAGPLTPLDSRKPLMQPALETTPLGGRRYRPTIHSD